MEFLPELDVAAFSEVVRAWLMAHGITILVIIVLALVVRVVAGLLLERVIRRLVPASSFHTPGAEKQREDTLIQITRGTLGVLIWVVAALMVLSEMGIEIGPLLAAAGVAGLAIGFGGQYLIRDIVAGLFIILENQYRVGDVVSLDSTTGSVEAISIRMATLRDLDGTVHHIPHGTVNKVSNLSKEFARVNLSLGVSYEADLEKVIEVINSVGSELAEDAEWKEHILDPIKFTRVNEFADSAVVVKVLGETKPLQQWAVAGEFRKRIKIAFDKTGIEIPFPQRVMHEALKGKK